jgi:hypothetical protein
VVHERVEDEAAEALAAGIGVCGHAPNAPAVTAPGLPRRRFSEHRAHRHHVGVVSPPPELRAMGFGATRFRATGFRATGSRTIGFGATGLSVPDRGVGADGVVVGRVRRMLSGLVRSQDGTTKGPHHLGVHEFDAGGVLVHRWRR